MKHRLLKSLNKFSIGTSIAILLIAVMLVVNISMFIFVQSYANSILLQNLNQYLLSIHQDFENNFFECRQQLYLSTLDLTLSEELPALVTDSEIPEAERRAQLTDILDRSAKNSSLVRHLTFVTKDGVRYESSEDSGYTEVQPQTPYTSAAYDITVSKHIAQNQSGEFFWVFEKPLVNYNKVYRMGTLLIYVNHHDILQLYSGSAAQSDTVFITFGDTVLSHEDEEMIGRTLYMPDDLPSVSSVSGIAQIMNKDIISDTYTLSQGSMPLSIVTLLKPDYLYRTLFTHNKIVLLCLLLNLLAAILVSCYLSAKLIKALKNLCKRLDYGTDSQELLLNSNRNEISILEQHFHLFTEKINALIKENDKINKKQRESELTALQAQINPHFIYNALDSVRWMARIKKQPEIESVCSALSTYFRLGLHKGDRMVSVCDEINHVKSYITVEQMRFPDLFDVSFDIDESLNKYKVPKIILQPIVENAIKHGFDELGCPGHIHISCKKEDSFILFKIQDNGNGMDFDPLTQEADSEFKTGYGLSNIHERIVLEYGKDCGLSFESAPGEGTAVTIKIRPKLP